MNRVVKSFVCLALVAFSASSFAATIIADYNFATSDGATPASPGVIGTGTAGSNLGLWNSAAGGVQFATRQNSSATVSYESYGTNGLNASFDGRAVRLNGGIRFDPAEALGTNSNFTVWGRFNMANSVTGAWQTFWRMDADGAEYAVFLDNNTANGQTGALSVYTDGLGDVFDIVPYAALGGGSNHWVDIAYVLYGTGNDGVADTIVLYLNGTAVYSAAFNSSVNVGTLAIGAVPNGGQEFNGLLDRLVVMKGAATQSEIQALSVPASTNATVFVHPGLLHTEADLARMRQRVAQGVEPWASAFTKLANDAFSQSNYAATWQPASIITGTGGNTGQAENDTSAAYQLALMWCLTSNSTYAAKSIQILNNWSSSLTNITGSDKELAAGYFGMKLANAAELLRYINSGWAAPDIAQFSSMLTNVFYPVIANFAPFANGNWDIACEKALAAIGIFCDRPDIYLAATNYFHTGVGRGALTHYVYSNGQCQESGRDQTHTQLGLGSLAELCEMAWNQGSDLYGAVSNRLLAGFEYAARYNLGYDVPFIPDAFTGWSGGIWYSTSISDVERGQLRPIYEMVYNHYVNRQGLEAPFTTWAATQILAPEGNWYPWGNHPGFGTLTFSLVSRTNWPARIQAESYNGNSGVSTEACSEGGLNVCYISSTDYIRFASVNLANVNSFVARVANNTTNTATIKVRLNSSTGPLLGTCEVPPTKNWQGWITVSCNLMPTNVVANNLFLVFEGFPTGDLLNLNWFSLEATPASPHGVADVTTFLTGAMTPVDVGGQPAGRSLFGGESVGFNSPGAFPVGTNFVTWYSTNVSGFVTAVTQAVVVAGPPQVASEIVGGQFRVSWPPLYTGWRLEAQTNANSAGLSANWATVSGSANTNQIFLPIDAGHGGVFLRLCYP